jgi:hypothetical protein
MSLAWMFLVAAELIAATKGLGYLLSDGRETSRPDIVLAAIIVLALLGKLSDGLLAALEKRCLAWRDTSTVKRGTMSTQPLLEIRVSAKPSPHHRAEKRQPALLPREAVSLLGPSGCGKSTLLRIVAGLETDFQGELRSREGEVAFVFQEPRLMPWLTVEQNIGLSDDDHYDKAWVAQLIEEVGLRALPRPCQGTIRRHGPTGGHRPRPVFRPRCCCSTNRSARWMPLPA